MEETASKEKAIQIKSSKRAPKISLRNFQHAGAGFRSIGYTTDGILIYSPMHEVGDVNDGASLSTLNGDVIDTVNLYTGGFPPKYGDRTAGL